MAFRTSMSVDPTCRSLRGLDPLDASGPTLACAGMHQPPHRQACRCVWHCFVEIAEKPTRPLQARRSRRPSIPMHGQPCTVPHGIIASDVSAFAFALAEKACARSVFLSIRTATYAP
jgi:hypothetical protein